MTDLLRFSIIINTYNRAAHLEKLLPAFHHLAYDQFEVIVVNGPSTDGTAALLERYQGRIKIVDCPAAHMTRSRNLGLQAAAGEIVVFIDDDARPAEVSWLNEIAEIFRQDTAGQVGVVGGPVFHQDTTYFQFKGGMTSDYCHQVFWEQDRGNKTPDGKRWTQRSMGCNSVFRRSALLEIGGFDENITYYADESDVCLRLARRGYKVVQPENCAVRHYPVFSQHLGAPFLRNRRVITKDDTYFCLKNGLDEPIKCFFKTLWLAPGKHFVREMPQLWRNGQISFAQLLTFFGWDWLRGLLSGLWLGIFQPRRMGFKSKKGLPFLPFTKNKPERRLNIYLLSEVLPPDPKAGGIANYTRDQAYGLHELGHNVHIITRSDDPIRRESLGLTIHGIPESQITANLFPDRPTLNRLAAYSLAVYHKLLDLLYEGYQVDVVETSNWGLEGLTLALSRLFPFPVVMRVNTPLIQAIQSEGWPLNEDMRACVALEKWLIEHVDALIVSTTGVVETSRKLMGVEMDKHPYFKQVILGLKPQYATQAIAASSLKRLLYVGRFEHRKGTHVLLEILPALMAEFDDWECYLVGANDNYWGQKWIEEFRAKAKGRRWKQRVHFTGAVSSEALQSYYKSCDLFVAPSLYESFGIIYLEAMQYGKPVVGCRVGGIPEVVTDGEDGLLVKPGDGPALYKALAQLMANDDLRQRLGQCGLQKMRQEFSHLVLAENLLAVYQTVIATKEQTAQIRLHYLGPQGHSSNNINLRGSWQRKLSSSGKAYLQSGEVGDSIHITGVQGDCTMEIAALCHAGAGVMAVTSNSMSPVFFDLFHTPQEMERRFRLEVLRSNSPLTDIQITIHPERNPASLASEVWLKHVIVGVSS